MKMLFPALTGLFLLPGFIACTEKNVVAHTADTQKLLTALHNTSAPFTIALKRDNTGRIIRLETEQEIYTCDFYADSVTYHEFSKTADRLVYEFKGKTDQSGRLESGRATSCYITLSPDTVLHNFVYDKEGYLVKLTEDFGKSGIYTIVYEYQHGDMVCIKTFLNGVLRNTKELEYTSLENSLNWDDYKFGRNINAWAGRNSRHMVKKITSVKAGGQVNYTLNYQYETDNEGLPVKQVVWQGKKVKDQRTFLYIVKA